MIQFNKVSKIYPSGYEALSNLSFDLDLGEMVFLTGHSGAGKSTLLKLIMLMERPTSGDLLDDFEKQLLYFADNTAFGCDIYDLNFGHRQASPR